MAVSSKARGNALLAGAALFFLGMLQLLVAYNGYKTRQMIPAGHVQGQFITPTQGFIVAGVAFAFAAYAFARGLLAKRDGNWFALRLACFSRTHLTKRWSEPPPGACSDFR
jgi:hypothetical protein